MLQICHHLHGHREGHSCFSANRSTPKTANETTRKVIANTVLPTLVGTIPLFITTEAIFYHISQGNKYYQNASSEGYNL